MDDISKKRWEKVTDPNAHSPRTALEAMLERIDDPDQFPITHVVIAFATDEGGGLVGQGYKQAGSLDRHFGCVGLLSSIQKLMMED